MCRFFRRLLLFLTIVSMITAALYYFIRFCKQYSSKEKDLPHDMEDKTYQPTQAKRHYTNLIR